MAFRSLGLDLVAEGGGVKEVPDIRSLHKLENSQIPHMRTPNQDPTNSRPNKFTFVI